MVVWWAPPVCGDDDLRKALYHTLRHPVKWFTIHRVQKLKRDLRRIGAKRQRARQQATEAGVELQSLIRKAFAAGIPKVEICRLAQISRPALDTMLKDGED
jgi:hypothetical protein